MHTAPRPPVWLLACVATFLAYFALLVYCDLARPENEGMELDGSSAGLRVSHVEPGGPAGRAGLREGDEIVRASGRIVRSRMDWSVVAANFSFDLPTRLEVLRQGALRTVVLQQGRESWQDWLTREGLGVLLSRAVQAVSLALALLIVRRRPRDSAALLGAWVLAVFGVFCVVLPYRISEVWRNLPPGVREALWLPYLSTLVLAVILFTFFLSYPYRRVRSPWIWLLVWAPMVGAAAPHARYQLASVYSPVGEPPPDGFTVLLLASFSYLAATAVTVVQSYRAMREPTDRRRVRVLVAGTMVACISGVGGVAGYWMVTGRLALFDSPLVALAALLMLSVPASFSYAILRHRLFDLSFIVRQGVRYALARRLLLSLVPLLLVVLAADVYVHRDEPIGQLVGTRAPTYAVLVSALLVAQWRRHEWLDALDRRFFRERYDTSRILRQVAADIEGAATLEQAAARVAASIHLALHPTFVSVLTRRAGDDEYRRVACVPPGEGPSALPAGGRLVGLATVIGTPLEVAEAAAQGDASPLSADEAALVAASHLDLLVPVPSGPASTSAVVALGPRRSDEPYASEDLALLGSIARGLGFLLDRQTRTSPSVTTFGECPRCGICYDHWSTVCSNEGTPLVPSRLPRVFAGRYRLENRLGQGGMGVVYCAHDEALDRPVAVKVLREELVADPRSAERFQREARLSARFSHPHVVTIHDFGVLGEGRAFLVMELLHGRTLREELAGSGRLARGRALEVLRPVCSAVGAAHRRQLVHRDLKPENVFLADMDGVETPKVLDFGIAKISGMAAAAGHGETGVGLLLGTPQYMAPEQLRGEEASPAWDLWSLAVVAYELLTGGYPVPGWRPGHQAWTTPPAGDVSRLAGVLESLGEREHGFFRQALAIDPAGRPATAEGFLAGLEDAISEEAR